MSKILIVLLLSICVIAPPVCPVDSDELGEKIVTDIKWTTCDGKPSKLSIITDAYIKGTLKKDGVICLFQKGEYLESALIVSQEVEVKVGLIMLGKETIANTFVAYPGKIIDTTDIFTLPLDPLPGSYKILARFFDEFGAERACMITTFMIKETKSAVVS